MKENMKKQKTTVLILMITLCLAGIWGIKGNTTVQGAAIEVEGVLAPHDIPAVAVELNKNSKIISEELSEISYTVYTETDALHIPVSWDVSTVNMKLPGVYTIKGTLNLSSKYDLGEIRSPQVQTTVSVQYPDKPDINTYYRLTAAGLYIFPWLEQEDTDSMEAYLKKNNGQWINLTEEGVALCDERGLYVSNQSMIAGNTYSLLVTCDNGRKQTGTLRFQYRKDGSLKIYSYQYSRLGNIQKPGKTIRSYDTRDEKYLSRCAAYALKTGGSLKEIEQDLKKNVRLKVSTAEKFENTAENPELILESSWDMSQVNTAKQGVYKVTGSFVIPEGYEVEDGLTFPEAYAYLSVQKKGKPQINTYSMPTVDLLEFPMLMEGFSAEERQNMQVYLSENKGNYQRIDDDLVEVTPEGIQIYYREILKKGKNYDICAVYEEGSTGIYSFSYNDAFIVNEYWYERNFSDREEKNLPDIVQRAPDSSGTALNPSEENEENLHMGSAGYNSSYGTSNSANGQSGSSVNKDSAAKGADVSATESSVTELSTDTIIAVSGQRMLLMIQQNGSAKFEKQGISVIFSSDTVNGWKISADDEIQIRIEKTAEAAFSLRIFVRGEEVTEIPGTTVKFLASVFEGIRSPETVKAEDIQGNQYTVNYQEKQNILRMEIGRTGDYFLTDSGSDAAQPSEEQSAIGQNGSSETEGIEDWTDGDSVEVISDGDDTGFTEEESLPEDETKKNAEDSCNQFLTIAPPFLAICVIIFAMIVVVYKKRR